MLKNTEVHLESFQGNKYLEPFYQEMKKVGPNAYNKYAYPVQMVFLKSRLTREENCNSCDKGYIIDRSIYEDRYIFAENQIRTNQVNETEYSEYIKFFEENCEKIRPLDIAVYLRAKKDTLVDRIKKRGRELEAEIDENYLADLNVLYDECLFPALKEMSHDKMLVLQYDVDEDSADEVVQKVYNDIIAWATRKGKVEGEGDGEEEN